MLTPLSGTFPLSDMFLDTCITPSCTQMTVASVLGVGAHRVVVKVKRMGGGFGGKESRFGLLTFHFHFLRINLLS